MISPAVDRPWRARPELLALAAIFFCIAVYALPMASLGAWAFRDR
ncbi:MAG: hypothetical protein K0Q60_4479, partial [Microvirga sp.]|nr:hypothetical protein [Microvirga sp.]